MHEILATLAMGFSAALVLGYLTQRLSLSPIVGYLLAGIAIGPRTPGFVGDLETAANFAEIGVILLMFGVGLHFHLKDLLAVWRVALPGAVGQILVSASLGALGLLAFGESATAGLIAGIAISVASTVVLIRVLSDNRVLESTPGHIAVGWLVVEDLFTVLVLVVLPALSGAAEGAAGNLWEVAIAMGLAAIKVVVLAVLVLWGGRLVLPRILAMAAGTRTSELFTLAVLSIALAIATGSALFFDVSVALGAFLAGMVVGRSEVSHQAAADALPMRDAFAVLFFVSVGMLFDPRSIAANPALFLALLGIILIAKPLTAIAIVWLLGYSPRAALTVAIGLAQIGEFSFILANLAVEQGVLSPEINSLIVACAILTIMLNPILFRAIVPVERWLKARPTMWRAISRRSDTRTAGLQSRHVDKPGDEGKAVAVIVGYGPVGQTAARILKGFGVKPVIVDLNVDTVRSLWSLGDAAVYGDGARREVLVAAGVSAARYLLITVPDIQMRTVTIIVAKELNPALKVFVRARYMEERAWLEEVGATDICYEEAEAAIGLARLLLVEVGAPRERISRELEQIRTTLALRKPEENEAPPRLSP